jgi:two-component system response regulator FixJ
MTMTERIPLQTAGRSGDGSPRGTRPDPPERPTVFVVEDDPNLQDSLRWLIESVGLRVECFGTAESFLETYDGQRPGCVLADVRLPGMSGVALQAALKSRETPLPVIVMTAYAEVATAVHTMTEGAVDFIEKPFGDQQLLDSIAKAVELDREARRERAEQARLRAQIASLTARERQILAMVTDGCSSKTMAGRLNISEKTVEVHRARLMKKLDVDSIADLIRLGLSASRQRGGDR